MAFENKILSPKDSAYVDSLILYDKAYRSNYRFWNILESNCTDERFHERIWEIYFETRELRLLYYIAISHKEKDFDLVMSAFEKELAKVSTEGQYYDVIFWTLAAMDNWPDIRFRGLVTEIGKKYAHNSFHVMNGYLLFVFVLQQDIKWGEPFIKEVMETIIANDDKDGLYIKQSARALYMANITVGNKKYQRIVDRYCSGYDENVKLRWTYQESGYSHLIKTIKH